MNAIYEGILSHFPKGNMRLVFAYGSGVFQQTGHVDKSKNMLDFIFAVKNPVEWHQENIQQNSKHYSALKHLGPSKLSYVQEKFGARVYFNIFHIVKCEGRQIKYGVISTDALINDLLDWETLYVSGRLHKPVCMIQQNVDRALVTALSTNLQSAVHTALLLRSDCFTEEQMFETITGLSYSGDFRMTVGEDKNKVKNIVKPNLDRFRDLYSSILDNDPHLHWNKLAGSFEQSLSPTSRLHHLNLLPKMLQYDLVKHRNKDGRHRDTEEVLRSFAHDSECKDVIQNSINGIVRKSSLTQSIKGIATAGISKSIKYSFSKLKKMWKSKRAVDK